MTATEVWPGIYVGDLADCLSWRGESICVLEHQWPHRTGCRHVRILEDTPRGAMASVPALEHVADLVRAFDPNPDKPILIHCGAGVERSPLAATWVLYRRGLSLEAAWQRVLSLREIAQDRRTMWLPAGAGSKPA